MLVLGGLVCVSVVLSAAAASAPAKDRESFFVPGGVLELRPLEATNITSLSWKHETNLLCEWIKDAVPLKFYGRARGRAELNLNTGVLVFQKAEAEDAGSYTLELNNYIQKLPYVARLAEEVPQPEVVVQPVSCDLEKPECRLLCEGDVSRTGAVTYWWKRGEGEWEEREKVMVILNDATVWKVETFTCRIQNQLGFKDSKPVKNPLYQPSHAGLIGGLVSGGILLVALVVGGGLWYKKKRSSGPFAETELRTEPETSNALMSANSPGTAENGGAK